MGSIQPCSIWHITDDRYFRKNLSRINLLENLYLSTFDTVSSISLTKATGIACISKNLGRDGFSEKFGQVYHGCSVLHEALQFCYWAKYENSFSWHNTSSTNVLQENRISYKVTLPQFVYFHQLRNLSLRLKARVWY